MERNNVLKLLVTCFDEDSSDSESTDESESDSSEVERILDENDLNKVPIPRVSILKYYELTVQSYSEKEFITNFRISPQLFWSLSEKYGESAEYVKMLKYNPNTTVPPDKTFAVFLWFAAHEACAYRDIQDRFNISLSTVHACIARSVVFLSNMSAEVIRWPSLADMQTEAAVREGESRIPGIVGCLDGTHIIIDPPSMNKNDYFDRKGHVTLVVQAVCDMNKKFIDGFVGYPGSVHDSRVFRNSTLSDEKLPQLPLGYRVLADSAYPCTLQVLPPYKDDGHLTPAQRHFNTTLSRQRVDIEHAFGIWKQRFRQLYYCKLKGVKFLCHFFRACMVLHNLSNCDDLEFMYEPEEMDVNNAPILLPGEPPENGFIVRDTICEHIFNAV